MVCPAVSPTLIPRLNPVHFLRFELGAAGARLREGAKLAIGVDHAAYGATLDPVPQEIRAALVKDLA